MVLLLNRSILMPNSLTLPVQPSQLPSGFCPSDYQSLLNEFSQHQSVPFPDTFAGIIVSATKPTDTTRAWLALDQFGRPIRLYSFAQGAWLSLHPLPVGATIWWFDVLPDFTVFDGGDANPLTSLSGAMWQQAKRADGTLIAAQFPLVAGTLPSGTVLNVGNTGGEEKHLLTLPELPPFTVTTKLARANADGDNQNIPGGDLLGGTHPPFPVPGAVEDYVSESTGGDGSGNAAGHNTMPPYVVGYLLQRTSRLFYSVT
jgi:hypothetical protein